MMDFKDSFLNRICDLLVVQKQSPSWNSIQPMVREISHLLKTTEEFDCPRVYQGGSLSRGTAPIFNFDVKLIAFINSSSYHDFVSNKKILIEKIQYLMHFHFPNRLTESRTSKNAFYFHYENRQFQIFPALNLVTNSESKYPEIQNRRILKLVHAQPNPPNALQNVEASIAEMSDQFVAKQSPFAKRLIMFCKRWSHVYLLPRFDFNGQSSIIDIIAVSVAMNLESQRNCQLFKGFEKFLKVLAKINSCCIEFDIPSIRFRYELIRKKSPYILCPMNPYHNRLAFVGAKKMELIMNIAKNSLRRTKHILYNGSKERRLTGIIQMLKLSNFDFQQSENIAIVEEELESSTLEGSGSSSSSSLQKKEATIWTPSSSIKKKVEKDDMEDDMDDDLEDHHEYPEMKVMCKLNRRHEDRFNKHNRQRSLNVRTRKEKKSRRQFDHYDNDFQSDCY